MFAVERFRLIRNYLVEHRQAEVHALSGLLDVSEVTVRRDLEKLEHEGFLVRTHGGAVVIDGHDRDDAYVDMSAGRRDAMSPGADPLGSLSADDGDDRPSREIGELAARLVADGDTVMLTGGKLTRALARALSPRSMVTVLTNDLVIAREVACQKANRAVLLGGEIDGDDLAAYGPLAQDDLQRFHVDRLFAVVDGFGDALELSASTQQRAALIREARLRSREFVILCSSGRFERNAFYRFGAAAQGDTVVTDRDVAAETKQLLFRSNVRVFTALDVVEGTV